MKPGIILRSLCEQHPESVARLFEAHKVGLAPTADNIVSAYKSLGQPFLTDLNTTLSSYMNLEGDHHPRSGFGKAVDEIGNYFKDKEQLRLYNEGRLAPRGGLIPMRSPNGGVIYVPAQPQVYTTEIDFATGDSYTQPLTLRPDRIFGVNKNLFLVLAGALAMIVLMELFQRKGR